MYSQRTGFVTDLSLDHRGAFVAMAPCCGYRTARLIVASVTRDRSWNVLAKTRRFTGVGGIGWSPNGQRLVFEGSIRTGNHVTPYLWTIRRDGARLTRRTQLHSSNIAAHLAWTRHGIVYEDDGDLRLLDQGASRRLVRAAVDPQVSGNGRWLFLTRYLHRHDEIWRSRPDGSSLTKVAESRDPDVGQLYTVSPSYDGRRLLAVNLPADGPPDADHRTIVFDVNRGPASFDRIIGFTHSSFTVGWN